MSHCYAIKQSTLTEDSYSYAHHVAASLGRNIVKTVLFLLLGNKSPVRENETKYYTVLLLFGRALLGYDGIHPLLRLQTRILKWIEKMITPFYVGIRIAVEYEFSEYEYFFRI